MSIKQRDNATEVGAPPLAAWREARSLLAEASELLSLHPRMIACLASVKSDEASWARSSDPERSARDLGRLRAMRLLAHEAAEAGLGPSAFLRAVWSEAGSTRASDELLSLVWAGEAEESLRALARAKFSAETKNPPPPPAPLTEAFRRDFGPINDEVLALAMRERPELVVALLCSEELGDVARAAATMALSARPSSDHTGMLLRQLSSESPMMVEATMEALHAQALSGMERSEIILALSRFRPGSTFLEKLRAELLCELCEEAGEVEEGGDGEERGRSGW